MKKAVAIAALVTLAACAPSRTRLAAAEPEPLMELRPHFTPDEAALAQGYAIEGQAALERGDCRMAARGFSRASSYSSASVSLGDNERLAARCGIVVLDREPPRRHVAVAETGR